MDGILLEEYNYDHELFSFIFLANGCNLLSDFVHNLKLRYINNTLEISHTSRLRNESDTLFGNLQLKPLTSDAM